LYCLRTKKVPLTDFMHGLNQPHTDQIDLSNLPRFGCRAYKLISPKPGKFEPRAEKGWFLGFQQNTSKNFIIYHSQRTPSQRLKWILSFTPHVTFNEDVMFGEKPEPGDQQQSVRDCIIPTQIFITPTNKQTSPLTRNEQTASQSEGGHQRPTSEGLTTESHPLEDMTTESPLSEDIDMAEQSPLEDINLEPSGSESMILDPPSPPEESLIHPVPTECTSLLPTDICHSPQSTSTANDTPIYEELQTPSSPVQTTQLQLTYPSGEEQTQSPHMDLIPLERDASYQQEESNSIYDASDTVNNYQQLESQAQGELHSQEMELDYDASLDNVMTGWQPIPIAGQKRQRSPEAEMIETRHGRKVKKYDYSLLHHGRAAHASSDPVTWGEAMTSTEAAQWKIAAAEEFRSLKDTGTIEIIPRHKLPIGRKPMKCKEMEGTMHGKRIHPKTGHRL
ncbi:hypothetical protein K3495_g15461, partial [Podosphaera aphanis]